jgi:hypothetical protein
MTDPRNIPNDRKVRQEKKGRGQEVARGAAKGLQPGRKPHMARTTDTVAPEGQVLMPAVNATRRAESKPY